MNNRVFHSFSILVLFFLFTAQSFGVDSKKSIQLDPLHEAAPDIELSNEAGVNTHLADFRGKNVILHFWASWCEPCKKELTELSKLAQAGAANGVVLLPVSGDDSTQPAKVKEAEKFLKTVPGNLPFYVVGASSSRDRYLTWGIPVTYFINKDGKLIGRALGPRNWQDQSDLAGLIAKIFSPFKLAP